MVKENGGTWLQSLEEVSDHLNELESISNNKD